MAVYNYNGSEIGVVFNAGGNTATAYDMQGNPISGGIVPKDDYERTILACLNEFEEDYQAEGVVPLVVHTDQHGGLTNNTNPFVFLGKAVDWEKVSCIGLGDVCDFNEAKYQEMQQCLSSIPKKAQINIWGNHDTWSGERQLIYINPDGSEYLYPVKVVSDAQFDNVLCRYFDNSSFRDGHHRYNRYGIEYMFDKVHKVKYVVIGGWEFDGQLGGHSRYNIGQETLQHIIEMLSTVDDYDIVLLSHVSSVANLGVGFCPPVEDEPQGGGGSKDYAAGKAVMTTNDSAWNSMLNARRTKDSGVVYDSYGHAVNYDFTQCTSDLICNFGGHEHVDKYGYSADNILVYLFDAYAYDQHPFYLVNIHKGDKLKVWKIDKQNRVYKYDISLQGIA